jgi:hypothetical protein
MRFCLSLSEYINDEKLASGSSLVDDELDVQFFDEVAEVLVDEGGGTADRYVNFDFFNFLDT